MTDLKMDENSEKKNIKSLNLLESMIQIMKRDNCVTSVMERIVSLTKSTKPAEKEIICRILDNLLDNLKDCKHVKDLEKFETSTKCVIFPKELKSLEVDESYYQIAFTVNHLFPAISQEPVVLGRSQIADVFLGKVRHKDTQIVVKKPTYLPAVHIAINEAVVMSKLNHPNIVKILGFRKDMCAVITEYMNLGNLEDAIEKENYMKENIIKFIIEVCKGMEYMVEKKIIHRNLTIKSVFLTDKQNVKVGDFKFSQYVGDTDGVFICDLGLDNYSISPESFKTKEFRMETDLYAMGILIWDAFYHLNSSRMLTDIQIRFLLEKTHFPAGAILPKPPRCPKIIFSFIKEACLDPDYKRRPTFTTIKLKLQEIVSKKLMD